MCTLQFADDQAVLAGDNEDLEYMACKLIEVYEESDLDMNLSKTNYLCIGNDQGALNLDENTTIDFCQITKFGYYFWQDWNDR